MEVNESSVTSCPFVLMSAKSGAGDPNGGMDGVAAQDAASDPGVTRTAQDESAAAALRSRNPRRPILSASLCMLDAWRELLSFLPRQCLESMEIERGNVDLPFLVDERLVE